MVKSLIPVATFSSRALENWSARNMRESIIAGYHYTAVTSMVTSEGLPGGSHAACVYSRLLSRPMVPCFGLLFLWLWFRSTDADLNPWGVKWTVCGGFWVGPFPVHGAIMVARATLWPCGMHGAVWRLPWGVNRTLWAVVSTYRVKGAVCRDVCSIWVKGAFRGALVSCSRVNVAVSGTWGVNRALGEGFGFSVSWAVGGVCLVWTLVQRGGTTKTCGKAAEGCRTDEWNRSKQPKEGNKYYIYRTAYKDLCFTPAKTRAEGESTSHLMEVLVGESM